MIEMTYYTMKKSQKPAYIYQVGSERFFIKVFSFMITEC